MGVKFLYKKILMKSGWGSRFFALLGGIFLLAGFFLFGNNAYGFEIPEAKGFVNDYADVLSVEEERALEDRLAEYSMWSGVEIAILLVDTIGDEDISMLAVDIAEEWGVGQEQYDNGIFMLFAIEDRQWFISVGYGLEGVLPDAIVRRVGEASFPDYFLEKRYFEGIDLSLDSIFAYLSGEENIGSKSSIKKDLDWKRIKNLIFLGILLLMFVGSALDKNQPGGKGKSGNGSAIGKVADAAFLLSMLGGFRGGGGSFGGGFGGFGGGGFGGGGAGGGR